MLTMCTIELNIDNPGPEFEPVLDWLKAQGPEIDYVHGIRMLAGNLRLMHALLRDPHSPRSRPNRF
jgi:hypothetical protein